MYDPEFSLEYDRFDPEAEGLRESMTSTGNGYFCTRGAAEWEDTSEVHYPGTYAHRCYNRETTIMGGSPVHNEDLVNLPNWLVLKLRIDDEDAIRLSNVEVLSYRHVYDIRTATVIRELRFRDRNGRETSLVSRRFVSMAHSHQAHSNGHSRLRTGPAASRSSRPSTVVCRTARLPVTAISRVVISIRSHLAPSLLTRSH